MLVHPPRPSPTHAPPAAPSVDPVDRQEAIAVAAFGALMIALLAIFLYPLGGISDRWMAPHVFMPEDYYDERFLVFNAMALLWLPMLYIFGGLRREPSAYGFRRVTDPGAWRWVLICYLFMLPFVIAAAFLPWFSAQFQATYPLRRAVRADLRTLFYFELCYGFYFFCWEWFFRGYLLFGLWRGTGVWAIPLQAIPFGFLHWGKPPIEMAGSFVAGIALALLALRGRSFLPCFVLHWAVAVTMDLTALAAAGWRPF